MWISFPRWFDGTMLPRIGTVISCPVLTGDSCLRKTVTVPPALLTMAIH
jgi:hypothetical protein